MTDEEFNNLKRGDIIRQADKSDSYVVDARTSYGILAVKIMIAMNPSEWYLIKKE